MDSYNPNVIEPKWQKYWAEHNTFHCERDESKKKFYALVEFPYPSGQGLHVGHPRPYTAMDVVARKRRLEGYNVLFPMGWDAFGLPTENYAIKHKIHPAEVTRENVANFKRQMQSIGFSFDWDREINTTDPAYVKWTQWIFLQLYKHGLAYKDEVRINWCPSCKIGLANEEVVGGHCERCGHEVVHRVKSQWMLKITAYADRLIDDLETVDFAERIKTQQINWIGRSHGAKVDFPVTGTDDKITVFTTRPDTIFGATYMVVSPEHPLIENYKDQIANLDEVRTYQAEAEKKSDFERTEMQKDKTGVRLQGISATNPVTGEEIPIYVSDYVLMGYGTGAIMSVPAHDERDFEFAKKFGIEIRKIIEKDGEELPVTMTDGGVMVDSGFLDGMNPKDAMEKMIAYLEEHGMGERTTSYKLRDWVFSRQRYWGEPIPLVHCEKCGWVPLPESELPLTLPDVENYEPTDNGESPLAKMTDWVETTCPHCGGHAERETDTMPQWAGSSWYYLRYTDPHNDEALASKENIDFYTPVDWYNGGMEHTTLHLLYSRFLHKFLYDIGVVPSPEPYQKRTSHGMILGEDHEKMSKSRGNVVNPDEIVKEDGADTLRMYEMFIGDFEKTAPWSENGLKGCRKFLGRVWNAQSIVNDSEEYTPALEKLMHQTIAKVSYDYENLKYNTAIAALMTYLNAVQDHGAWSRADLRSFLLLLNPVSPHITEEIWERQGLGGYLHEATWPVFDPEKAKDDEIDLPVQIGGKMRGTLRVARDIAKEDAIALAKEDPAIGKYLEGKTIVKEIFVPGRIMNLIVK